MLLFRVARTVPLQLFDEINRIVFSLPAEITSNELNQTHQGSTKELYTPASYT